jgi:subtilisin family serine protease
MKNNKVLYVALLAAAIVATVFTMRYCVKPKPCPPVCLGYEEKQVTYYVLKSPQDTEGERRDTTIRVYYECNEIILDGTAERAQELRDSLKLRGFELAQTCACTDKLELWRYAGVGDADVIGVVKDPPGNASGIGLNYRTSSGPLFNPKSPKPNDSTNKNPTDTTGPSVKIAIVDTGVDISLPNQSLTFTDPQSYLFPFLTQQTKQICKEVPYVPFGLNISNMVTPLPADLNGHGTQVNGIIAGYPLQAGSNTTPDCKEAIHLDLINIRFTKGDTKSGSLFDAVCGMYYALQQRAEVINVSWGYLDDTLPEIMIPLLEEALAQDVVIVAGLGNDGRGFGGPLNGNLRFWPAGFSSTWDNVISVGACDDAGNLASFSNRGSANIMNVVAPGVDIISTFPKYLQWPETGLVMDSGTSFATPFVTRTVAMMIGEKKCEKDSGKDVSAKSIKQQIMTKANPGNPANFSYKHDNVLATW